MTLARVIYDKRGRCSESQHGCGYIHMYTSWKRVVPCRSGGGHTPQPKALLLLHDQWDALRGSQEHQAGR